MWGFWVLRIYCFRQLGDAMGVLATETRFSGRVIVLEQWSIPLAPVNNIINAFFQSVIFEIYKNDRFKIIHVCCSLTNFGHWFIFRFLLTFLCIWYLCVHIQICLVLFNWLFFVSYIFCEHIKGGHSYAKKLLYICWQLLLFP